VTNEAREHEFRGWRRHPGGIRFLRAPIRAPT
jgi:hypothetical protein